MSMSTRRSSRPRNRRFAPSSRLLDVDGDDNTRVSSPRTPLPGGVRVSSARASPSAPTTFGRASASTQGPPSSLPRAASRSVGNQGRGSVGTPGKFTGVSKAICVSPEEVSTICCGKIGAWGVCADPTTGPHKCVFKSHKKDKDMSLFADGSTVWCLPGQNRRAPEARVIVKGPVLKDYEITTMCRQVLQLEEKTLEGWKEFFAREENISPPARDSDSGEDDSLSDASQDSWESLPPFSVLETGIHVPGGFLTSPLEFTANVSDPEATAIELRETVVDIFDKVDKLKDYTTEMEESLESTHHASRGLFHRTKTLLYPLLYRTEGLEKEMGDTNLPHGASTVTDAIANLSQDIETTRKQADEDFAVALTKIDELQSLIRKEVKVSCDNLYDQVAQDFGRSDDEDDDSSTRPAPAPAVDVSTKVLVDGQLVSLEDIARSVFQHDDRLSNVEEAVKAKGGVVFAGKHISSEKELKSVLLEHGFTGMEISCVVDCWSLSKHEEEEIKDADKTASAKTFVALGYSDLDARVTRSNHEKTISVYCGTAKTMAPGTVADCFSTKDKWNGTATADGRSAEIIQSLHIAASNVGTFADDHLVDGDMQIQAKGLALRSLEFHTLLHKHIHDTHLKLSQRGMDDKNIRILLSNQVYLIFKEMMAIRRKAYQMSIQGVSKIDRMVRQLWVTLQVHQKMDEFLKYSFEFHPVISSSFVRFLTDHLASGGGKGGSSGGYDEKALKKLLDDFKKKCADQLEKCADQLEELSTELGHVKSQVAMITRYHPELLKAKKKS
eukprot:scaffold9792_cov129-Skeletonema_dohrnii-CCMP3373.AAC.1